MGKTKIGVGRCQIRLAEAIIRRDAWYRISRIGIFFPTSRQAPPCAPAVAGIEL
jgi:hypothetical protein